MKKKTGKIVGCVFLLIVVAILLVALFFRNELKSLNSLKEKSHGVYEMIWVSKAKE